MTDLFAAKFCFKPQYQGYIGVERECFLTSNSTVVPSASHILNLLPQNGIYGYELSACQLEMRTNPVRVANLNSELTQIEELADRVARSLDLRLAHIPVAPEDMPTDVYPDPTGRYARIVKRLPHEVLVAACRVAAVHIHIGVKDRDEAVTVYNRLVEHFDEFKSSGDTCNGQRMELYRLMASDAKPSTYSSWDEFQLEMQKRGYAEDPRQCWDLIRISTHGTVEVRVFDSTDSVDQIVLWAEKILGVSNLT